MRTQALFHFGMPKTGTSLLQNVMHMATRRGPFRGVHYPDFGRNGGIAHHALPEALLTATGARGPADLADDLLADLAEHRAAGKRARIAFYSSEGFANHCGLKPVPRLAEFLDQVGTAMPVRSVLVVREVTSFLESMYLQSARYGHVTQDFATYLAPRERWWANMLGGVAWLQDRFGPSFEVRLAEPGYDVISDFANRLSLPLDRLLQISARVAPTSKLSWKAQIVLANLTEVEAMAGFPIHRQGLVKTFQKGMAFRDDLVRYTLYPPGARAVLAERLSAMAVDGGLQDYARVFAPVDTAAAEPPHVTIDLAALTSQDIERLRRARARIGAGSEQAA